MDIVKLLGDTPGLMEKLGDLGIQGDTAGEFANEVGQQVAGDDGLDLSDILTSLDATSFLQKVDAGAIAGKLGLSPEIVQQGLQLVAPAIEQFAGEKLGVLGKLAGSFFKR
ncbi:MAG: hypothetical protein AAF541_06655 [Pseudomonadota bacterium]